MTGYLVADVMTRRVVYLSADTTLDEAAIAMRDGDIGDVVMTDGATLAGMVTDRDIVIRAVADRLDPAKTTLGEIATRDIIMIEQHSSTTDAANLMRERGVRRVLVCDAGRQLVGIVSLGDLAVRLDPGSAAADITVRSPGR